MNTKDTKPAVVEVVDAPKVDPKAAKVNENARKSVAKPDTVEDKKERAKEVDQGESAEQLLEQARPYVKLGGFVDYSGSPEAVTKLAERIDAYFVLKAKK